MQEPAVELVQGLAAVPVLEPVAALVLEPVALEQEPAWALALAQEQAVGSVDLENSAPVIQALAILWVFYRRLW